MGIRKFLTGVVVGIAGTIGLSLYLYIKDNDLVLFDLSGNISSEKKDDENAR